jgi:hypothetical protein
MRSERGRVIHLSIQPVLAPGKQRGEAPGCLHMPQRRRWDASSIDELEACVNESALVSDRATVPSDRQPLSNRSDQVKVKHRSGTGVLVLVTLMASLGCREDSDRVIAEPTAQDAPLAPVTGVNAGGASGGESPGGNAGAAGLGGAGGGELSSADQLTSEDPVGACEDCPTPALGAACCTGMADIDAVRATAPDACGVDMAELGFPGCTQLAQPGELDSACPPVEFPPGSPPMAGCCTAAGHCGAMETFMGFGCTSNPDASTWVDCGG